MSEAEKNYAIQTAGLARSFGDVKAVDGMDLEVRRGEMFGLVGPDGAGKSTAIRLLCGILRLTGGKGSVLGFDLTGQPEEIKKRIGYLSQGFTLYGDLTIDENIEFFAELHGVGDFEKRRDELLAFMRLTPFRDRLAQALSGGMKKKLALACTLIHTPELIFLDEPSTGVDPVSRGEFWNILSGVLAQGVTILMTTPYIDEAERCSRVGLMHRGKMFMVGTPEQVRSAMPGAVFNIDCPDVAGAYKAMKGTWSLTNLVLFGSRLRLWSPEGEAGARNAVDWLNKKKFGPAKFSKETPSLEDAFIALLGSESDGGVKQ